MPIVVNQSNSVPSTQISLQDWDIPDEINIVYSKGGGSRLGKNLRFRLPDFSGQSNYAGKYISTSITGIPLVDVGQDPTWASMSGSTSSGASGFPTLSPNDPGLLLKPADSLRVFDLTLMFDKVNLLLIGEYQGEVKILIMDSAHTVVETHTIPLKLRIIDSGAIVNNLSPALNFCLDPDLFFQVQSQTGKFARVKYQIYYKSKAVAMTYEFAFMNNLVRLEVGKPIQPYIYLNEAEIRQFFALGRLDMVPAIVNISVEILDGSRTVTDSFLLGDYLFHAGRSAAFSAPAPVRGLNYNSVLPMAYLFSGQFVDVVYRGATYRLDKQVISAGSNILQLLFRQSWHGFTEPKPGFSAGFGPGFTSQSGILHAKPLFSYKESKTYKITADGKTAKAINMPWAVAALNVVWLDENNRFQSLTFSGESEEEINYLHLVNERIKDFDNKKSESIAERNLSLNSGFRLASEIPLFDKLLRAKRAWVFGDNPAERREVIPVGKKMLIQQSSRDLVVFKIDFTVKDDE